MATSRKDADPGTAPAGPDSSPETAEPNTPETPEATEAPEGVASVPEDPAATAPSDEATEPAGEVADLLPAATETEAAAGAEVEADREDQAPAAEAAVELVDGGVQVTFHGAAETSVQGVGLWKPDETKPVPAPLAARLCRPGQAQFTRAAE